MQRPVGDARVPRAAFRVASRCRHLNGGIRLESPKAPIKMQTASEPKVHSRIFIH
jgi:hypothetical protein